MIAAQRRGPPPETRTPAGGTAGASGKARAGQRRTYREAETPSTLVATVRRNAGEELRVALVTLGDLDLIDVRTFADVDDQGGERTATRRGVCLVVSRLPELRAALEAAEAVARDRGLLAGEGTR